MSIINSKPSPVKTPFYSPLVQQWSQFVSRYDNQWNWWTTLTFRESRHPEAAAKTYDTFIHTLNKEIFGNRYYKKKDRGVIWSRATERQDRGAIHYHCLIGNIPDCVRRMDYVDYWDSLAGFARIFKYEPGHGAEAYLSKTCYAFKHGEIDLGGPLAALNPVAGLFG